MNTDLWSDHLPWLLALAVGVVLAVRAGRTVPVRRQRPERDFLRGGESASAMLDFVLVFPLFMMIVLIVIQLALLINARLVVSYAAYTACRSAIVWMEEGEEAALEHAETAAKLSCIAISPAKLPQLVGYLTALPLSPLYIGGDQTFGEFFRRLLRGGPKYLYSIFMTETEISYEGDEIDPHDPISVTVTHQFYLSVPYADGVFRALGGSYFLGLPVMPISDTVTLLNEGKVTTPT